MTQPGKPFNPEDWELVTRSELGRDLNHLWQHVLRQEETINQLGEKIVATQADLDALAQRVSDDVTAINAEITALQQANPQLDLSGLQAAVSNLDSTAGSAAAPSPSSSRKK
jgi:septal ring factor EnvC (AmiA/AmiB activator)